MFCMKLEIIKNKNDTYYYVSKSIRRGKSVSNVRIHSIGSHSKLLKDHDDPLSYALEVVKKYNEDAKEKILSFNEKIDFNEKIIESDSDKSIKTTKNVGYLYLEKIFDELKIDKFIEGNTKSYKFKFSLLNVMKLLTFSRILEPKSKLSTFDNSKTYLTDFDLNLADIYRGLDVIDDLSIPLQSHLYSASNKIHKRKKTILYYDCTNYYFEIENEDFDIVDEEGNIIEKGLRKYGISKENRPNPIIQMGLFIDEDGIPVSFCLNPGNTNEQVTAIPLEKRIIKDYKMSKFIYCSDAGLGSNKIKEFNSFSSRAYIVSQSLKKLPVKEQELIFKDVNWKYLNDDKKVSINLFKEILDKKLNGLILKDSEEEYIKHDYIYKDYKYNDQRIIITFSKDTYIYQRTIFLKQKERALQIIKNNKIKYSDKDIRRFIKSYSLSDDGEVIDKQILDLDNKKIEKEEKYHGYYACNTNLEDDVRIIFKLNKNRWKIENCFRIMKTSFKSRPVYLQNEKRIKAHFTTCYLALLIFSLLKVKLNNSNISDEQLLDTLKNMNIILNEKFNFGQAQYNNSMVLEALENTFNLGLNYKNYDNKTIKKFKK